MSGCDVVWIIIAMSTSSKCPRRSSSGLPPRNSRRPARACCTRHSTSPYSSAGTAKNTTRPARCSKARASQRPMAAPRSPAIWALWPQACAAPVSGSAIGCPATTRPSSSPSSATVGPSLTPEASARTPVRARPLRGFRPSSLRVSSASRAVLNSLKPSSGWRRMRSPRPMMRSRLRSIALHTESLSSFLVVIGLLLRFEVWPLRPYGAHRGAWATVRNARGETG
jgi:hypothetical protein